MSTQSASSGSSGESDPHIVGSTDDGAFWQSEYEAPTAATGDPQETAYPSNGLLLPPLPFASDESSFSPAVSTDLLPLSALVSQQRGVSSDPDSSRTSVAPRDGAHDAESEEEEPIMLNGTDHTMSADTEQRNMQQ